LFISLVLILFSDPDHLPKNLYVQAVALSLLIDFLFGLGQFFELFFDLLNAFNNRAQLITCTSTGPLMVYLTLMRPLKFIHPHLGGKRSRQTE
jgi:hypothetical protein